MHPLKVKEIELTLNKFTYNDAPLGSLLSFFNNQNILRKREQFSGLTLLKMFIAFLVKGISYRQQRIPSQFAVLLSRIGNTYHLKRLVDPIKAYNLNEYFLYAPDQNSNHSGDYNFPNKVKWTQLYTYFKEAKKLTKLAANIYRNEGAEIKSNFLFFVILIQIVRYDNWTTILADSNIALVITDFDRDTHNSPLVLASKKLNIKTATLVHGVIPAHFAFVPLLADEIWVWGKYQSKALQSYGVAKDRIKIVGNPIAKKYVSNPTGTIQNEKSNFVVGIAINPMSDEVNFAMLNHILSYKNDNISWFLKLHPAMNNNKVYDKKFQKENNIHIVRSSEMTNSEFFETVDLLILGNSGIGYEAIINDVPIAIFILEENQGGHDETMVNLGRCPKINDKEAYFELMNQLSNPYLSQLLSIEKEFVLGDYYNDIDTKATENINKEIEGAIKKKYAKTAV